METSENAVKSQTGIAISVYVLVAIIKKRLNLQPSPYTILQVLSVTAFDKAPLTQILRGFTETDLTIQNEAQLYFEFSPKLHFWGFFILRDYLFIIGKQTTFAKEKRLKFITP